MYTNAQSLVGKVAELSCVASDQKPDVILVTESWCNKDITDAFLTIPGYEVKTDLRMDRADTGAGRGGGLIIYARSDIPILKLDQVGIHIQLCKFLISDVTVYLVYRSPNAPADSISELAEVVRKAEKNSLLFGDFNLPDIDWSKGVARGRSADFMEAVQDAMMEQLVDFPTQVRGNVLDLVITNIPERVEEVCEEGRLGRSDHVIIMTRVRVRKSEEESGPAPDWRRADWDAMRADLRGRQLMQRIKRSGVEEAWRIFAEEVTDLISIHVPERRKRNNNRPPWLNQEILRAIRKKKRMWKECRGVATKEYKEVEKKVRNMIRNSKRGFEKKLASGNGGNKRPFFAYVKLKTQSRPSVGPLKDSTGATVSDNEGMADLLNRAFKDVFTREDVTDIPEPGNLHMESVLETVSFDVQQVKKKIRGLRTEAAPGPDGIGPRVLKELQDGLAPALAAIFTKSLESGVVPQDWKEANVTPIFKKGAKSSPGNYRPVSLTSVSCKIMESVLRDGITQHLTVNKLINNSQHGFLKDRSCVTNLLEFLEVASTVVDSGDGFDIIYLDFAKAFDKVPRERLLRKIYAHGIRGPILGWIRSWLTGRKQRVVLNGRFSSWEEVLSGVPQGSVLGPLLFVIFINDLDNCVVLLVDSLKKFADDTKLGKTVRGEGDRDQLQSALDRLCSWADSWGMEFNVAKCKVMHTGHRNPMYKYQMKGQELEETREERDIGVVVTSNLKPAAQCAKAAQTAQTVLGQLTRAFHYRDRHVFVRLYKQYVRPHLEFSTQAWSPWTVGDKETLEKVQRRAVKMVSGLESSDYNERLRELGLDSLEERRYHADMAMVYRITNGHGNLSHGTWFEKAGEAERATRSSADPYGLRVKHGRLEQRRNFFSVRVIEAWNSIPPEIRGAKSCENFRNAYKKLRATRSDTPE